MKVSISRVKTFKACRRSYFFKYMEDLTPVNTSESLTTGKKYHELIELYHNGKGEEIVPEFTMKYAMFCAYRKYIFPFMPSDMVSEVDFDIHITDEDELVGRVDGYCQKSGIVIEHKTTSMEIDEAYEYDLLWDEQILAYMLAMCTRTIIYTVCRKPNIRMKKNETDEEFFYRMVDWYEEDTASKIRVFMIERTEEEVSNFKTELVSIIGTMKEAEFMENMYRNTLHCFRWGRRCEYAPICLNYNKNEQYVEFKKGERYGIKDDNE